MKLMEILKGANSDQADYFAKKYVELIKVNKSKDIFFWNKETLLWDKMDDDDIPQVIINFYRKKIEKLREELTDNRDRDELNNLKKKITTGKYSLEIWKLAKPQLKDKEFELKLNKNANYLPIKNGKIINLETGEVRNREITDLFSFECNVKYLQDDKCKHAKKFISEICGDDKKYIKFMIKYLGYCLTGHISDRGFAQFFGVGKNGKSKLIDQMKLIMGNFFASLDSQVFIKQNGGSTGPSPHLMPLQYARLAVYTESSEGESLNVAIVNKISGGDEIVGRDLYKSSISFTTQAKLAILTNHPLKFNAADKAVTDRLRHFPFLINFTNKPKKDNERKADDSFIELMRTKYLDEFFTLLVNKGSKKWYENKEFNYKPKVVKKALENYLGDLDLIGQFIGECCEVGKNKFYKRSEFNVRYKEWFKANDHKNKDKADVQEYMKKKYKMSKGKQTDGTSGIICYYGVGPKEGNSSNDNDQED